VNDTAGHAAGDFVLTEIATLLKSHIRGTDIACRYGGEEFTLVLPNATLQSARIRAEAICAAIREEGVHSWRHASLGVAIFPDHAAEPSPCCARPTRRSTTRKLGARPSQDLRARRRQGFPASLQDAKRAHA